MSDRTIRIERAGLQSLVVDRGRFGLRHQGVGWCGAMDARSYAIANELVGNAKDAAAIEIVLGDVILRFDAPARFALTGADCSAELDGEPIVTWTAHAARAGARLVLRRPRAWMRTIVAIDGGIDVPLVLGSRTTDLTAAMGGFEGRALRAGDRLRTRAGTCRQAARTGRATARRLWSCARLRSRWRIISSVARGRSGTKAIAWAIASKATQRRTTWG